MGFEQLAKLRDQLSKSAKSKAPARAERNRAPSADSKAKPAADGKPDVRSDRKPEVKSDRRPNPRPANPVSKAKPRPKPPVNAKPVDPVVVHIGRLQKRFPEAFPKNPAPKVPLKIGIFEDLIPHTEALKLTQQELREAIKVWCRGSRYWSAMSVDAIRVDLAGAEAGRVSPEDAVRAQKLEEARLARVAAKAQTTPAVAAESVPAAGESAAAESTAAEPAAAAPSEPSES